MKFQQKNILVGIKLLERNAKLHPRTNTKRHNERILHDLYKVLLKEFCEALQTKLLYCFIGSRFWKIYWKKFQQKFLF